MAMTIVQAGSDLSGSFTKEGTSGGSLSGTVTDAAASVTLTFTAVPECRMNVVGPVNGDRWRGRTCTPVLVSPSVLYRLSSSVHLKKYAKSGTHRAVSSV